MRAVVGYDLNAPPFFTLFEHALRVLFALECYVYISKCLLVQDLN